MTTAVIIPASTQDDAHRTAARHWVMRRYAALHPTLPVTVAMQLGGPWRKADAVNPTIEAVDADVLVIADGDSFTPAEQLDDAVASVASGRYPWATPATQVRRLTEDASRVVLDSDPGADPDPASRTVRCHSLLPGGGIVVVRRDVWLDVGGYDPRFVGWGGEDYCLGCALRALSGTYAAKQAGVMWHLWHPPAPSNGGLLPDESAALAARYREAKHDPALMRGLLAEREA